MKFLLVGLLVSASMAACVSAHVDEPSVCSTQPIDFGPAPTIPAGVLPSQSVAVTLPPTSVTFDMSGPLGSVGDVASNLQATINELTIDKANLGWVSHVDVQIQGSATDGSTPLVELGSADSSLVVHVALSPVFVLHYLQSGLVTLSLTVSGNVLSDSAPSGEITSSMTLCASASGDVSKHL
jgi:hypothetical protein